MGCDIHMSIEYRIPSLVKKGSITQWMVYALDIPDWRDYEMFTYMAGVRGYEKEAVDLPRGIPEDVSPYVQAWVDRWGSDAHSHSYLYPGEYADCVSRLRRSRHGDEGNIWGVHKKLLKALEKEYGKNNARIVFFFDN